jgi:NADP-dependent 3-hydroxy acid dehydrogenase YdfG
MSLNSSTTLFVDRGSAMNPRIRNWQGARVWVIGASTGIGAATASLLLTKGAQVALSARNASALQTLADNNSQALVLPLDITQHADVQKAHDHLLSTWGGIDIVLIVAGIYNEMRADSIDMTVVNQVLDINLRGTFNCLDVVLPTLLKQTYGGIGMVSSVAGFSGLPKALVYGPTKAAFITRCESL